MLPLVVIVETNDGQVRRYAFADSPVSIGRSPFSDLQLTELFVSRWEGTVRFDEHEITYFSLGSTNPTFVDGRQVVEGEDTPLTAHSVVTLGELTMRFSRAAIPDADLRRKGKPKPRVGDPDTALKTAYLEVLQKPVRSSVSPAGVSAPPPSSAPPPPPATEHTRFSMPRPAGMRGASSVPPRPPERPSSAPSSPSGHAHGDVRMLSGVTVLGIGVSVGRPDVPAPPSHGSAPHEAGGSVRSPVDGQPPHHAYPPSARHALPVDDSVPDAYAAYRAEWARLLALLDRELQRLPPAERAAHAERISREQPEVANEPEFRQLLKRHGLPTRRSEVPEVSAWLADIARDVLPARMHIDSGLTLDRILGLLETLTQSIAEINDAQDTVRQRWLGRQSRRSVLRSDNGRAVLAYLLNPQANWNDRLVELEQTIRQAVTHELALFQATMEGARMLVDSLSPEALAKAEDIDLESLSPEARKSGFWNRLQGAEAPESRLWRAFVKAHQTLLDSNRYQRVFMGRSFARTYLAAMGQKEARDKT